jgi:hypothetical protein
VVLQKEEQALLDYVKTCIKEDSELDEALIQAKGDALVSRRADLVSELADQTARSQVYLSTPTARVTISRNHVPRSTSTSTSTYTSTHF